MLVAWISATRCLNLVALYSKRRQRRFAVHNSETSYKKTVLNEEIEYGPQVLGAEAY
jgi:hypothetical protein